jgi:hypothetical protein
LFQLHTVVTNPVTISTTLYRFHVVIISPVTIPTTLFQFRTVIISPATVPTTLTHLYIIIIPLTITTTVSQGHVIVSTNGNSLKRTGTEECLVLSCNSLRRATNQKKEDLEFIFLVRVRDEY